MALSPKLTKFSTASPVTLNVDFIDFVTGVGVKRFYAADVNSDTRDTVGERILTTETITSSIGFTNTATTADYDFDIVLTRNLRVGGECVINIPYKFTNVSGGQTDATCLLTVTVRHWDGSTETDLGSETTLAALTVITSLSLSAGIATIRLNVTEKQFKIGDTLRLTIVHGETTGAEEIAIGHDPAGRITVFPGVQTGGEEWTTTATTMDLPIILDT